MTLAHEQTQCTDMTLAYEQTQYTDMTLAHYKGTAKQSSFCEETSVKYTLNLSSKTECAYFLIIEDLPIGETHEELPEVLPLVLVPAVKVSLEVGVGARRLVVQSLHLAAQLDNNNNR